MTSFYPAKTVTISVGGDNHGLIAGGSISVGTGGVVLSSAGGGSICLGTSADAVLVPSDCQVCGACRWVERKCYYCGHLVI